MEFLKMSRWLPVSIAFLAFPAMAVAQCANICGPNLLCNPDFEITVPVVCNGTNGQLYTDQTPIECWYGTAGINSPQNGITPDNFNSGCRANSTSNCGSGRGSAGVFTTTGNGNAREYIQSRLDAPLQAGKEYCISFQIRGGPSNSPNDGFGVWFTNRMIDITTMNGGASFLGPGTQVNATPYWQLPAGDVINACTNRTGTFCAQGGETWIVLGNFRSDANTTINPTGFVRIGYLIVDNMSLAEVCPPVPPLQVVAEQTSIPCGGSTRITASGGSGTYTWIPSIGAGPGPHTVNPTVTTTYTLVSPIQGNCGTYTDTARITINVGPCGPTVTTTGGSACPGGCANVQANATGGPGGPPYNYVWSPNIGSGAGPHQVCPTATTTYTVTVTDATGGTGTGTVTVTIHPPTTLATTPTNTRCFGGSDGSATVTPSGGTAPHTYSWNSTPPQTGQGASGLPPGTYTVTSTDANGCTATATATIGEPPQLLPTTSSLPANCGVADGSATVTPAGGTGPYTFSWNTTPTQTTQTAANLPGGTYTVTVTDANGCNAAATVTVAQTGAAQLTTTRVNVSCGGGNDGSATVSATGGNPPYTYSWNTTPPQTTPAVGNLPAGTWTVTVTDSDGCIATAQVVITEPPPVVVVSSSMPANCGRPNGSASVTASGGSPPYTYAWNTNPAQTAATAMGIPPGPYTVTVTDGSGCSASATVTVSDIPGPLAGFSATDACTGAPITFSNTSSGQSALTSAWVFGDGGLSNQGNPTHTYGGPGSYTVTLTVTDAAGCTAQTTRTVTVHPQPDVDYSASPLEGCVPVTTTFTNNIPPPGGTCLWNFGDGNSSTDCNGPVHTYTRPGCYDVTLTVTSQAGCTNQLTNNRLVCVTAIPDADFGMVPSRVRDTAPIVSFINRSTDATRYYWEFNGGATTSVLRDPVMDFGDLEPGDYSACLWAINDAGCRDSVCKTFTIFTEFNIHVPNAFSPDGDGFNEEFRPILVGFQYEGYELLIFNRWGELVFETNNPLMGWNGFYNGVMAETEVYVWKLRVRPEDSRVTKEFIGHVTLLR